MMVEMPNALRSGDVGGLVKVKAVLFGVWESRLERDSWAKVLEASGHTFYSKL